MQKSIKLAFLGLILASVAAPAMCGPQGKNATNNTLNLNKKNLSSEIKRYQNACTTFAVLSTIAIGGSTISLAIPLQTSSINNVIDGITQSDKSLLAKGLGKIAFGLFGMFFSIKSSLDIAIATSYSN